MLHLCRLIRRRERRHELVPAPLPLRQFLLALRLIGEHHLLQPGGFGTLRLQSRQFGTQGRDLLFVALNEGRQYRTVARARW